MKTIVILAHPNIEQSTVNKTWVDALSKNSAEVGVHDIYKTYPDWNIDVAAEQQLLEKYDRIVFQYPIYWYNMPPLLKKWFDEVFAYGWCYGANGDKLEKKNIGLVVSTGGVEGAYTKEVYGEISTFVKQIEATAKFVRANFDSFHVFHGALSPDASERLGKNTEEYLQYVTKA